jgi:hypothetical protein
MIKNFLVKKFYKKYRREIFYELFDEILVLTDYNNSNLTITN